MTIETRTTIEPWDIATVEFECRSCHSVTRWPLAVAKNPPISCHCGEKNQWMPYGGEMYAALTSLIALMQRFAEAQNEPFILRLGLVPSAHASGGGA